MLDQARQSFRIVLSKGAAKFEYIDFDYSRVEVTSFLWGFGPESFGFRRMYVRKKGFRRCEEHANADGLF